jgi:hypothetical protein
MRANQREKLNGLRDKLTERQNACNRTEKALTEAEAEKVLKRVDELLTEAENELK